MCVSRCTLEGVLFNRSNLYNESYVCVPQTISSRGRSGRLFHRKHIKLKWRDICTGALNKHSSTKTRPRVRVVVSDLHQTPGGSPAIDSRLHYRALPSLYLSPSLRPHRHTLFPISSRVNAAEKISTKVPGALKSYRVVFPPSDTSRGTYRVIRLFSLFLSCAHQYFINKLSSRGDADESQLDKIALIEFQRSYQAHIIPKISVNVPRIFSTRARAYFSSFCVIRKIR